MSELTALGAFARSAIAEHALPWQVGPLRASALRQLAADRALPGWTDVPVDLFDAVTTLAAPPDVLCLLGGDDRLIPVDGRNSYGFPAVARSPRLRLSSCTAVPPDGAVLDAVDRWRQRTLEEILVSRTVDVDRWRSALTAGLGAALAQPAAAADRMILCPSGTDAVAVLSALFVLASDRPLLHVLVGAREAGGGIPAAAAGRRSQANGPFTVGAPGASLLDPALSARISAVTIDVRDRAGRPRRAFDVEAEIDAHVDDALGDGKAVVVHCLDRSKTHLRQPTFEWVAAQRGRDPHLYIVVDAAQGRLSAERVTSYLDARASVLLTGSKFASGPPFSAAVLLSESHAEALANVAAPGLGEICSALDLPSWLRTADLVAVNYGLLARWVGALAELERWRATPAGPRSRATKSLVTALRRRLSALDGLTVLPGGSIVSVTWPSARYDGELARQDEVAAVYRAMVADEEVQVGQPAELTPNGVTVLRFAVGAATVTRLVASAEHIDRAAAAIADQAVELVRSTVSARR